jgi:hypothetical protein
VQPLRGGRLTVHEQPVVPSLVTGSAEVGLYKLNAADPQLESARFQPLSLYSAILV